MAIDKREVSVNVAYAMAAQAISLLLSVLMSLLVPKVLGVTEFGFWQLFIFYTSYGGMLPFGLYDGMYLKLGGKEYNKLNHEIIGTQFRLSLIAQAIILSLLALFGLLYADGDRQFVIVSSCIMVMLANIAGFVSIIQQTVNNTKKSSISIIINRFVFIVIVVGLLLNRDGSYTRYIIGYIAAQVASLIYCAYVTKEILFSRNIISRRVIKLYLANCKIGLVLTFANVASIFIIGIGRFLIDDKWGIETFGKVSFALTMTHFVLIFVNQVGLVFFPALRRCNKDEIEQFYRKARRLTITYLPASFIFVYPLIWFINTWLPKYNESIPYFFVMLPLCIYDGRMQMIGYTMLKVLRKERELLYINLAAVAVSCVGAAVAVYLLDNVSLTIVSMLAAVVARAMITEIYFARKYSLPVYGSLLTEMMFVAIFIVSNRTLTWEYALPAFILLYLVYFTVNKYKIQY